MTENRRVACEHVIIGNKGKQCLTTKQYDGFKMKFNKIQYNCMIDEI